MKIQVYVLTLLLCLLFPLHLAATPKTDVQFAGFAFLSNYSDIKSSYPYSQRIWAMNDNKGSNKIDAHLRQKIATVTNHNIKIKTGLGDSNSSELLSLALVLDWENVTIDEVAPNLFRIVINLHGQILIYDFKERHVVATFPFGVRVNDVSSTRPNTQYLNNIFQKIYFDKIAGINFLTEFTERLQSVRVQHSYNHRIKVSKVTLEDKALRHMPNKEIQHQNTYKTFIAQEFSKFLSANKNISILPYTEGHAIKGKMALRFNTTDVLNLTVPEEDIPIEITIRGFKKVEQDRNHTGVSWIYGSYIHLSVKDPLGDTVLNAKFKNAASKIIPSTQTQTTPESDWASYQESLLALFDNLTRATMKSEWINKHASGTKTKQQVKKFNKLIQNSL